MQALQVLRQILLPNRLLLRLGRWNCDVDRRSNVIFRCVGFELFESRLFRRRLRRVGIRGHLHLLTLIRLRQYGWLNDAGAASTALEHPSLWVLCDRFSGAQNLDEVLDLLSMHFRRAWMRLFVQTTNFSTVDLRVVIKHRRDEFALFVVHILALLALEELDRLRLVVVLQVNLVENPAVVRTEVLADAHVIFLGHLSDRDSGATGRLLKKVLAFTVDGKSGLATSAVALADETLANCVVAIRLVATLRESDAD